MPIEIKRGEAQPEQKPAITVATELAIQGVKEALTKESQTRVVASSSQLGEKKECDLPGLQKTEIE